METPQEKTISDIIKQEQKNLDEMSNSAMMNIGTVLDDKYEIKREIGRGGMGIVYEAYHKYTHKKVAIKVILADKVEARQLKRFQKELEAYSVLSHPNVIMIYDAGVYNNYPYIVMEYIKGVDVCSYIQQQEKKNKQANSKNENGDHQRRDWKLCARLIYETALGLDYIHSQKMIHRDIKPSNIIVRPNGSPVIIDLGLVKFNRTQSYNLTKGREIVGTIEYMPIEQAQGQKIDARTDVYSLGLVLYELLTGKKAYSGENIMELCYKIMFFYPPLPREIDAQIPEVLEKIIIHATEKEKEKRYASMKEFADALKQYLDDTTVTPTSQYALKQPIAEENLELAKKFYNEQDFTKAFELYEQSAKQGNAEAQCNLGRMYAQGKGVKQDYEKSHEWYKKSAEQGNAEAQCNLGRMYAGEQGIEQDYEKAVYWWEQSANQGDADAQYNLGIMYYYGQGVEQDYEKAVYWYEQSAKQNNAEAQFYLGDMYSKGQGVKRDYKKAIYWWEQSANQGDANARFYLTSISQYALNQPNAEENLELAKKFYNERNFTKAFELYEQSAKQDNAEAQCYLGVMYEKGRGVNQDYEKAIYWYEKSANHGHIRAQCCLGNIYAEGRGVKQNYAKAVYWYKKTANQGYAQSQCCLGFMYAEGKGVKQNYEKAVYWYEQSANQGYATAQCNLGNMYKKGQGVEQDYEKAVYWYEQSAKQGHATAQYNLGVMYKKGQGVEQDYEKAIYWYEKSARKGYAEAQYKLGVMYAEGRGVEQDYKKAIYWLEKSAEQEHPFAKKRLEELS